MDSVEFFETPVDVESLCRALGRHSPYKAVDLTKVRPEDDALQLLSPESANRLGCLPLRLVGDTIEVALTDPRDGDIVDQVESLTGLSARPFIAPQSALYCAIKSYYGPRTHRPEDRFFDLLSQIRLTVGQIERILGDAA